MAKKISSKRKKQEMLRCGRNPHYFIKNYCKLSHQTRGLIPFSLYPFQEEVLDEFVEHRFNIVLKARQLGISWLVSAFTLWMMMFHRNKTIMAVATKKDTACKIIEKVKYMYGYLPDWMQEINPIQDNNKYSFSLKTTKSLVVAESTAGDAGRSYSLSMLIIDEAAHVEGLDGEQGLWTGLRPTLATGGRCIALSTPAGQGGWFYHQYVRAERKPPDERTSKDFNPIKLMWWVHPDRDQDWYDAESEHMTKRQIAQEYDCAFNASGHSVISPEDLKDIFEFLESEDEDKGAANKDPIYRTGPGRNYWIWKPYNSEHQYVMSADVARGDAEDYSTFHILDLNTNEVVAEFQGKIPYDHFATLLDQAGREYGEPLLAVENNAGSAVLLELEKKSYPNLLYMRKGKMEIAKQHEILSKRSGVVAGFPMSVNTRPVILAKMEEMIRNKMIKIYSDRLYTELTTFIWKNGRMEAQSTANDDLVISFAILCWLRDISIEQDQHNKQVSRALLTSIYTRNRKLDTSLQGGFNLGPELQRKTKREKALEKIKKNRWLYDNVPPIFKG